MAIDIGQEAPLFTVDSDGGGRFSLAAALFHGPVVLVFFKVDCPTCQFTFPFLERLYRAYGGAGVSFVGISQDDAARTKAFCKSEQVTLATFCEAEGFPISNQYGITRVPTIYLIAQRGAVDIASEGFSRNALDAMSHRLARFLHTAVASVFLPQEIIPESKAGCGSKN